MKFKYLMKIINNAIEFYLELLAFENVSISEACRLGLTDTFCSLKVL